MRRRHHGRLAVRRPGWTCLGRSRPQPLREGSGRLAPQPRGLLREFDKGEKPIFFYAHEGSPVIGWGLSYHRILVCRPLRASGAPNVMLTGARLHARPVQLKLGYDSHVVAQEFGRKIRAIRPDERVELRMNHECSEVSEIAKRLKNGPAQFLGEVDFSGCTIAKPEPHNIRADVPCLENVIIHSVTPMEQFD